MDAFWRGQKQWVLPLTIVCFVLGGLLAVQVRTRQLRGATEVGRQTSALVWMLADSRAQLEKQKEETDRLRSRVAEYEEVAASEKGLVSLMRDELGSGRVALGVVPVQGPGIELVLDDSTMVTGTDMGGQDLFVIHDVYLLQVANELYASGAEAVSLNGHRLVAGSAITCSTRLIKVNDVAISNPFVFLAIGNKDNLVSSLNIRDGFIDFLRRLEINVKLTPKIAPGWTPYIAIAVIAGFDALVGALRSRLERRFDEAVFISGFFANMVLAALLAYFGDRIGVDLYLAVVVALGIRIFTNLGRVRALLITTRLENRRAKNAAASR